MSEAGSNDAMDTDAASVYVLITPQEFERLRNSPNDLVALCDEQHLKLLTMEREIANDKISTLKKETETLKSQIQSGEEHSASVLNAVEQKSIRIREERDAVINRNEVLEQKIKSLEGEIVSLNESISTMKKLADQKTRSTEDLSYESERLREEKLKQTNIVEKKDAEIKELNDALNTLNAKYKQLNREKLELEDKLNDSSSSTIPLNYAIEKIKEEKKLLEDQNSYLNDTLQKKSQELLKEKTTLANDLISLRSKLSEATEEIRQLEVAKSNLNAQLITFKTKADQNYNEIRELTESSGRRETALLTELGAAKRMSELAESRYKDSEDSLEHLREEYSEYKKSATRQHHQILEDMESIRQLNASLQSELDLLKRPVEHASPSLRSESMLAKGLSQSSIYQQLVTLSEENTSLKKENNMLKSSLDTIQHQIAEFSPQFEEQREEFERLKIAHFHVQKEKSDLQTRVRTISHELSVLKEKSSDATTTAELLESENRDLTEQVKLLLRECQSYKLRLNDSTASTSSNKYKSYINNIVDDMFDDEDDEFDPTDIVHKSEHTIGFRGIGELQKQIREVTKELRLAEAKHKQEIERLTSAAHENHQEQNRSLKERIETLSNNFTRVSQQMSVVVKEKDYYKELSKEKDRRLRSLESEPGQFTEIMSQSHQEEDKIHIMKQEFASMKEQLTNRYHDTRVELQKVAESLSVTKRDVQYWKDKFDNAESVVNSTNLEIAALRKNNKDLSEQIFKWQANAEMLQNKITELRDENNRTVNSLTQANGEKKYLERHNEQLQKDCADLRKSRDQIEKFYENMQAIQTTFDQRDKDQLRKLATDLELAKQEVTTLREKIEQERTLAKEATIQLELRTTDHQEKLAEKEREIAKYKEESIKEKSKAESFERENRNLVSRVSILERQTETRLNVGSTMQIDGDVGSIETETLRRDLQITQEALQTKRDIENDLISKLRSSEESRIEIISEYEKYREQIERERRESVTRIEQLQNALDVQASQVEEANQQRKQLERDLQQAHLENERQIGQLQALRNEVESTKDQFNNDNSGASELRRQYEEQKQIYEDIVVKSGKYLEEIAHNKEQIAELRRQLQDSQLRVSSLTNELGTIQNSYDQRESILRAELAQTNVRQKDLERARDILMSENETLNIQLKKILPTEKEGSTDEREEVDSLRELLRLIRREKEMVSSKLTVTEHESLRNKQMYEQAQRDIEHLRAEIEQLHSAQTIVVDNSAKEQLALLTESNQTLRSNWEKANKDFQDASQKLKQLAGLEEPLRRELDKERSQKEAKEQQIQQLTKEITYWQNKSTDLMEKYKQVDPEVHQKLIEERDSLLEERTRLVEEKEKLSAELGGMKEKSSSEIERATENWKQEKDELQKKAQKYLDAGKKLSTSIKQKDTELESLKKEIEAKSNELETVKKEMESKPAVPQNNTEVEQLKEQLKGVREHYKNKVKDLLVMTKTNEVNAKRVTELETELVEAKKEIEQLKEKPEPMPEEDEEPIEQEQEEQPEVAEVPEEPAPSPVLPVSAAPSAQSLLSQLRAKKRSAQEMTQTETEGKPSEEEAERAKKRVRVTEEKEDDDKHERKKKKINRPSIPIPTTPTDTEGQSEKPEEDNQAGGIIFGDAEPSGEAEDVDQEDQEVQDEQEDQSNEAEDETFENEEE